MDDSWQLKGANQSSSQWGSWTGNLNQINPGAGLCSSSNRPITRETRAVERTVLQEPTLSNMFNPNSQNLHARVGKPHPSHPSLAKVHSSRQQFPSDFQQPAISCTSYVASNQPWYITGSTNATDGGGWPIMAHGNVPLMGKVGAVTTSGTISDLCQGAQGGDFIQLSTVGGGCKFDSSISRPGGLDLFKQTSSHLVEMDLQLQYQVLPWQIENRSQHFQSVYSEKHNPQLLHKTSIPPVMDASIGLITEQAYRKPLLRPRVFCVGVAGSVLGGELTMAETGCLGVICVCHNWHMSVAAFSEHASLFGVNPGSSILMEGGETLAQWRKTFFSQFGVPIPEDHVGWGWDELSNPENNGVAYQSAPLEAHTSFQGETTLLKSNKVSWHPPVDPGPSNHSRSRITGVGFVQGTLRSQNLDDHKSMVVDKQYKGFAGSCFNETQAFSEKPYHFSTKNQGSNSTQLFWGGPATSEHANFSKSGSQELKRVTESSSAFNGGSLRKVVESCGGRYNVQEADGAEKDTLTSNFELRLGQPSQQNLSLGSVYSDTLHSRSSTGPLQQAKLATYEMSGERGLAWEQNYHQPVDRSILGRSANFSCFMGQRQEGTYSGNWLSNNQNSRDFSVPEVCPEIGHSHQLQGHSLSEVHPGQIFSSLHKHTEDMDARVDGAFCSSAMLQSLENRNCGSQRRAEFEFSTFTPLNTFGSNISNEARSDPQSHRSSTLLIRPMAKNVDGTKSVEDMFLTPLERTRPVMGPPETNSSTSEASAIKSSIIQTSVSWTKQVPCFGTSESLSSCSPTKLHDHTSSTTAYPTVAKDDAQQGLFVQTENDCVAKETFLGSSNTDAGASLMHMNGTSGSFEKNQSFYHQTDSFKSPSDAKMIAVNLPFVQHASGKHSCHKHSSENIEDRSDAVPNDGSLVVEGKSSSKIHKEKYDPVGVITGLNEAYVSGTRVHSQDHKYKEVSPGVMIKRNHNIGKSTMFDEAGTRRDVDAQADSAGVVQELPLSFRSPTVVDKSTFHGSAANAKIEENRSCKTVGSIVDSTAKELIQNDVLDEGSGIGKCCSSIEADMEAMTSMGHASSHVNAQVLESQTSMANSSSSTAVISDTLSNSVRVQKLFLEGDKSVTAAQDEIGYGAGQWMQKNDKKGRRPLKWKCLDEGKEKMLRVEDQNVLGSRKASASDTVCWASTAKSLKRKRSGFNLGPDLTSAVRAVLQEGSSRDVNEVEPILKWKGLKLGLKGPDETFGKKPPLETSKFNSENRIGKSKRINYQDSISPSCMIKAFSSLKTSLASGKDKMKSIELSGSSLKTGRGTMERHDFKAVKMASLSSILEVPKTSAGLQSKRSADIHYDVFFNSLQTKDLHSKFRQVKGLPSGCTPDMLALRNVSFKEPKKECCKRSLWEMAAKSFSYSADIPVGITTDSKLATFGFRRSWQNTAYESLAVAYPGKTGDVPRSSEYESTMIAVPLKFVPEKRLATEALHKESKSLLISSVDPSNVSGGRPGKRLRSQGGHAKMGPFLHTETLGYESVDEEDEFKQIRRRRKRRRRAKSNIRLKNKEPIVCCICGESAMQSNNVLVKCSRCNLGVHQACYGVTEVTKAPWICRPCKAHATNIVCVLCGYGEGAMTRAKKSGGLAKGLIQAWQDAEGNKEARKGVAVGMNQLPPSGSNPSHCDCKIGQCECIVQKDVVASQLLPEACKVGRNSVMSGIDDPKVTQWVHVVCALWMPGTRCINVETMAAFDVSGVARASRKWVCSICKRAGGACIKCRVPKCGTPFHPWCAHGKGLLQNEAFGDDEDKVGFFGKCLFHGNLTNVCLEEGPIEESACTELQNDNSTCARTEGGYKRGETSFGRKLVDPASLGILQEEVTAWLSIKDYRKSTRKFIKLANSDVKTHNREYVRYKQKQGWKRLAVYKSKIHALGLYTSDNIAKGEMVVEYVGEVIGLRVADKREADYLSNGRLQYRGACYLFRIDKEHIIDATHKGGIARFVNHSCSPNCVAKIICVGKQKKVVFFAEKDIAAGEELTYDYKLDFEIENRIPCYCKSSECRGFLN